MKALFLPVLTAVTILLADERASGQEFKNDAGEREKHFVSSVKQIDEFFDRFNDDPNSFVRKVYRSYKTAFKINREKLIRSLFNSETQAWDQALVDNFVSEALQVKMPNGKNWYGDNWFAELNCKFKYNNAQIDIPLILRIFTDEKKRSKWVIVGVKPGRVKPNDSPSIEVKLHKSKFIDPSSHGTNFIELERDFEDKNNLSDYFDDEFFRHEHAKTFYDAVLKNSIRFMYVKDIKYHFLNVGSYIFTVEYFPRLTLNSGWLISNLKRATASDKEQYRRLLLTE